MIDEGWMAAVVLLLLGIAVAAAAAAINLWRIADALEAIPGALGAVASSCASIKTPLETVCERYELLTDAQAGPIENERQQELQRSQEAQWARFMEQIRKGEVTMLNGEAVPRGPEEREAWIAAKTARHKELDDKVLGPPTPPTAS